MTQKEELYYFYAFYLYYSFLFLFYWFLEHSLHLFSMTHRLFLLHAKSSDLLPSHYWTSLIPSLPSLLQLLANLVIPGNLPFKTLDIPLWPQPPVHALRFPHSTESVLCLRCYFNFRSPDHHEINRITSQRQRIVIFSVLFRPALTKSILVKVLKILNSLKWKILKLYWHGKTLGKICFL